MSLLEEKVKAEWSIRIRKGWFFWQGQLFKNKGIPVQNKTYRAFTRDGLILKMESKKRNKISELISDGGWETDPTLR